MLEEKRIKSLDEQTEESLLDKLKNKIKTRNTVSGKIVIVPKGTYRIVCPNHSIRTIIELTPNTFRRNQKHITLDEFPCDCGTIYKLE